MQTKQALRSGMDMSLYILNQYISDLDDADLMVRPQAECNHLAWQLGHLISSEVNLLESICPGKAVQLPEGFAEKHSKDTTKDDNPANFCSKEEYQKLFGEVREGTLAALEELSDEDLDADGPDWIREQFPTVGDLFTLIGGHPMMHAGQFAVARRILGKPIVV